MGIHYLTGTEKVRDVLMLFIENNLPADSRHLKDAVFKQLMAEDNGYLGGVLDDECKPRWAYVQIATTMMIPRIILQELRGQSSKKE